MNSIFLQALSDFFDPTHLLGALTYALFFLVLAFIGARVVRVVADRGEAHLSDLTALKFVTQFLRALVFLVAFIIYAHLIPSLRSLGTTLLASAGVVSIIIGLAAQNTLGNLIAGFSLVLYRPFRIGDEIQINTPKGLTTGTVHALSLGYTVLRDSEGQFVVVPNNIMSNTIIILIRSRPQ
jgi:small-conductance mechanosensitive channel